MQSVAFFLLQVVQPATDSSHVSVACGHGHQPLYMPAGADMPELRAVAEVVPAKPKNCCGDCGVSLLNCRSGKPLMVQRRAARSRHKGTMRQAVRQNSADEAACRSWCSCTLQLKPGMTTRSGEPLMTHEARARMNCSNQPPNHITRDGHSGHECLLLVGKESGEPLALLPQAAGRSLAIAFAHFLRRLTNPILGLPRLHQRSRLHSM